VSSQAVRLAASRVSAPHAAPARRVTRPGRRLAALAVGGLLLVGASLAYGGTRVALARFTDATAVVGTFATGTWSTPTTWFLHNNPTPPTANTTAQFNLSLSPNVPTSATLFNYDTNCDSRAGRSLVRGSGLVTEATVCRFATWLSPPLAQARTLNGRATLEVWARKTAAGGTNPTLRAFLRVFDPATSTHLELGAANVTVAANPTQPWVDLDLSWTLASVTVPAGRRIEVRLVATGGTRNVEIAYDALNSPSSLRLP
jgi:hypothetical protein